MSSKKATGSKSSIQKTGKNASVKKSSTKSATMKTVTKTGTIKGFGSVVVGEIAKENIVDIWITWNAEKEKIHIPVNPQRINISRKSGNVSEDIIGVGEVTIKKDPPARTISFESFFPGRWFPGIKEANNEKKKIPKAYKAINLIKKLKKWQYSTKPVHFVCSGVGINIYCTIEDFSWYQEGGDVGTYYYSIQLKEYRTVSVTKLKKSSKSSKSSKNSKDSKSSKSNTKGTDTGWRSTGTATVITQDGAYIRKTANGTVLGTLSYNTKVEVDGTQSGDWIHVKDSKYGIGYVHRDRLRNDPSSGNAAVASTKKTRVNNKS